MDPLHGPPEEPNGDQAENEQAEQAHARFRITAICSNRNEHVIDERARDQWGKELGARTQD